jgi:TPR repeat protein
MSKKRKKTDTIKRKLKKQKCSLDLYHQGIEYSDKGNYNMAYKRFVMFMETHKTYDKYLYDAHERITINGDAMYPEANEHKLTKRTINWLDRQAKSGNSYAMYHLALMYHNRETSVVYYAYYLALDLLKKSASCGNGYAQDYLGWRYLEGNYPAGYLDYSKKEAINLFQKSAEQGNRNGQRSMATSYLEGKLIKKDTKKCIELLQKSVEQGRVAGKKTLNMLSNKSAYTIIEYDKLEKKVLKLETKEIMRKYFPVVLIDLIILY